MKNQTKNPYVQEKMERLERKVVIPRFSTDSVLAWMRHALIPDPLYQFGLVSSIYYDTPDMESYYECLDGDVYKNKVRFRWYNEPNIKMVSTAFIEVKSKSGLYTTKHRRAISISELQPTTRTAGEIISPTELKRFLLGLGHMTYKHINAKIMVTYNRHRFKEFSSGASISLDTDIYSQMIERTGAIYPDKLYLPLSVIEIKGKTMELPHRLNQINNNRVIWTSFSKYARCIESHGMKPDFSGRLFR